MNKLYSTLRNGIIAISALGFLALTSPAQAVPVTLNVVGGELQGASGVDVGGTLYDVEFLDGTCVALFDGCDSVGDFAFATQAGAIAAAQALLDSVFIDNVSLGLFDSFPELSRGISDTGGGLFFIPYGFFIAPNNTVLVENAAAVNSPPPFNDLIFSPLRLSPTRDLTSDSANTYARFTASPLSVVPLPPAGVLFGSGLIFLVALSRRARKRAQA